MLRLILRCIDVMHDIREGVANKNICYIINFYLTNKVFTLNHLNERIKKNHFKHVNKMNIPPHITEKRLKSGDLGFNASEMHLIILYFSLIIRDLILYDVKFGISI